MDTLDIEYIESHWSEYSAGSSEHFSKGTKKVTDPVTTSFEYSKLLATRAKQLSMGSPPNVPWDGPFDPIAIAKHEISQRVVPLIIERRIPDAKQPLGYRVEEWSLKDMDVRDW